MERWIDGQKEERGRREIIIRKGKEKTGRRKKKDKKRREIERLGDAKKKRKEIRRR